MSFVNLCKYVYVRKTLFCIISLICYYLISNCAFFAQIFLYKYFCIYIQYLNKFYLHDKL